MARRSRRIAPGTGKAIRHSASMPVVDRLVAAGPMAIAAMLAWSFTRDETAGLALSRSFDVQAPSRQLTAALPSLLVPFNLLQTSPRRPLGYVTYDRQVPAWEVTEELGDADQAARTATEALHHLQASPTFRESAGEWWRVLAAAEVVGFLEAELEDHYLDASWASHIEEVILGAQNHLSAARGFYFSWIAMRDVASAYLRFPHARDRLPHTLRSTLESKIKKAQNEGWVTRDFARHARHPETMLAAVYSKVITPLDERYLLLPPSPAHLA